MPAHLRVTTDLAISARQGTIPTLIMRVCGGAGRPAELVLTSWVESDRQPDGPEAVVSHWMESSRS